MLMSMPVAQPLMSWVVQGICLLVRLRLKIVDHIVVDFEVLATVWLTR